MTTQHIVDLRKRDVWLDVLRGFAIYLVIVGHIISYCIDGSSDNDRLRGIIYFIHIPLFLVISGCVIKDKKIDYSFWKSILSRFIIPYIIWASFFDLFFMGIKGLFRPDFHLVIQDFLKGFGQCLWYAKVFPIVIMLWQILKPFSHLMRLIVGSSLLVILNILLNESNIPSLSLYCYTIFGSAVCLKRYIPIIDHKVRIILLIIFLCCIPFALPRNDYFSSSFSYMYEHGNWHVFLIRWITGLSFAFLLLSLRSIVQIENFWGYIQQMGTLTLQIYLLQSLLVEAILPRFITLPNEWWAYLMSFILGAVMTYACSMIITVSSKFKICRVILWGKINY